MMTKRELERVAVVRGMLRDGTASAAREAAGLRKTEIARAAGVSRSAICRYEAADRTPGAEVALKLAQAYEVCLTWGMEAPG